MEISASRTGEFLVLTLTGRMDGTGAQQVTDAIRRNLTDHDTALIFDLGGVDYLSSAGLRVFQENSRRMKERGGRIAVCRSQEFVRKLFSAGGFFRIFTDYPTVEAALRGTVGEVKAPCGEIRITGPGWTLLAEHLSGNPGTMAVTGSLPALHTGMIAAGDVRETGISPGGFSIGIGGMAKMRDAAVPLIGEMVKAGGTVYWIPTDGNLTADFFTATDIASSGMKTFSLFETSFDSPFTDLLRITSEKPEGMTLSELYAAVLQYLKEQQPGFSGVFAVCMKATVSGLCSSDLKDSILAAATDRAAKGPALMPGGKTVTEYPLEGTVIGKASVIDVKPRYAGDILLSIGYGIDPALAGKTFPEEQVAAISYTDNRSVKGSLFLYNKGMVFDSLPWDNAKPFGEQFTSAPAAGRFVAMHNLLAITTVKSAVAGILPISSIRIVE